MADYRVGLEQALLDAGTIQSKISDIQSLVSKYCGGGMVDNRIYEYYADFSATMESQINANIGDIVTNVGSFISWLNTSIENELSTARATAESAAAAAASMIDLGDDSGPSTTSKADTAKAVSQFRLESEDGDTIARAVEGSALEQYVIDGEEWSKLPQEVQDAVKAKLAELGYTEEEIDDFVNGETPVSKVVLNAVSDALQDTLMKNQELAKVLIDKYGFNPFDDTGHAIPSLIASILLIDAKDPNDEYDIIGLLKDQYGVSLVDQVQLESLRSQLTDALEQNPDLRQQLIDKYGFDIFNEDGTINDSLLTMAMLMDNKSSTDSFDLAAFLKNAQNGTGNAQATLAANLNSLTDSNGENTTAGGAATNVSNALSDALNQNALDAEAVNGTEGGGIDSTVGQAGASLGGISSLSETVGEEGKDIINSLSDADKNKLNSLTDIIVKGKTIKPAIAEKSTGQAGIGALGAGLAGIGALGIAGGGFVFAKKKKEEEENNFDSDDGEYDENQNTSNSIKNKGNVNVQGIDGGVSMGGNKSGTGNAGNTNGLDGANARGTSSSATSGSQNPNGLDEMMFDKISPVMDDKNNKEWLYGLGIGLGAAAAAGKAIHDHNDDDEPDENNAGFLNNEKAAR